MLQAGAATIDITNEIGRPIQGANVDQVAESIRDRCEANALYLKEADQEALFISCDFVGIERRFLDPILASITLASGVEPESIILAGTHMHSGPSLIPTNPRKAIDTDYLKRLEHLLSDVATRAKGTAQPARIGWGHGSAQIGYNRRVCWADGTHSMHGDTTREDFTGLEGTVDPSHLALFILREDNSLVAVLYHNTTHPTSFYGANFYSADFPGLARSYLREAVQDELPVLYFNGAQGDIAMENQETKHRFCETNEQGMRRLAHLVTGETLRLLHEMTPCNETRFRHMHETLTVDIQLPTEERLAWSRDINARVSSGADGEVTPSKWDTMLAHGIQSLQDQFGDHPVDVLHLHGIRIGDIAILTQPCELYCQFGLDIKRRSPAPVTAVFGMCDGSEGYMGTVYSKLGGGYSGEPIQWSRYAAEGGYVVVDAAADLLRRLWKEG